MAKYFVDTDGNYLGGFDGVEPPHGAIEVAAPPAYGLDKWVNGEWVPHVIVKPLSTRLEAILQQSSDLVASNPAPGVELLALVDAIMGIDNKLSAIANRFGGDSPLYKAAAVQYLTALGELPAGLEDARQAMINECRVG